MKVDFSNYEKNPVILQEHNCKNIIGKFDFKKKEIILKDDIKVTINMAFEMGFLIKEAHFEEDDRIIDVAEVLEISLVLRRSK